MNGGRRTLPFAQQRMIFLALLAGMVLYAGTVAFVLQSNGGRGLADQPVPLPDTAVTIVAGSLLLAAFVLRGVLRGRAAQQQGPARTQALFVSTLVPLALIEGACLLATTMWMLSGSTVPHLVTAAVALCTAITIVPFTDPDATQP